MTYALELSREAQKSLDRTDKKTQRRIVKRLDELKMNPYDPRISKPLASLAALRSSRVGDWRIIYTLRKIANLVYVLSIDPRGQAYRRL